MVLAVDIGNTNIVLGAIEGERILFLERMATDRRATEMEYLVRIRSVLKFREIEPEKLEGAIVCSVVPIVTMNVRPAVEQLIGKRNGRLTEAIAEGDVKTVVKILQCKVHRSFRGECAHQLTRFLDDCLGKLNPLLCVAGMLLCVAGIRHDDRDDIDKMQAVQSE